MINNRIQPVLLKALLQGKEPEGVGLMITRVDEHTIQASIVDSKGQELTRIAEVALYPGTSLTILDFHKVFTVHASVG